MRNDVRRVGDPWHTIWRSVKATLAGPRQSAPRDSRRTTVASRARKKTPARARRLSPARTLAQLAPEAATFQSGAGWSVRYKTA